MKGKRVKKMDRKRLFGLVMAIVLTFCAAGGTIAWLAASTSSVTNTFVPAKVSNEVDETISDDIKKDVIVKNTGDVSAYVRAAVIVNWVDSTGNVIIPPGGTTYEEDTYCSIVFNTGSDAKQWTKDGEYYYYNSVVPADESTGVLIVSAQETDKVPAGYFLQVTILSEAIQAEGMGDGVKNAQQAWATAVASVNNS